MGIPHLITFLQPYAELEPLTGKHIVIDGPGFAYHIYYICCSRRAKPRGVLDAFPSYAEIGDTAIKWLDGLRESNATINVMHSLERSKDPLNLTSDRKYTLTDSSPNRSYYHANVACRLSFPNGELPKPHLRNINQVESYSMALPPVSFLVPAVLEALSTSAHYMNIIEVVPGEADLYCSEYLRHHGGVVFTGDSDLLVHDLGARGAVTLFRSVRPNPDADSKILQLEIYYPTIIAQRLSLLPKYGIQSLAFELFVDRSGTFPKLVSQARNLKAIHTHKETFENFRNMYDVVLENSLKIEQQGVVSVLRSLDPRISEYVLQFPSIGELAGQETRLRASTPSPHVFLPFVLDCAIRKSAWEISTEVRQLAYGIINLIVPVQEQISTVFEHKRQHDNSNGRELEVPKPTELYRACADMTSRLDRLKSRLRQLSQPDIWVAVAVYQDVQWSHTNSKRALSTIVKKGEFKIDHAENRNWDIIQLVAQIESSYYSFRILQQLTSLAILKLPGSTMFETILLLHNQVKDLPRLTNFKCFFQTVSIIRLLKDTPILEIAVDIVGCVEDKVVKPQVTTSKVAKNKRSKNAKKIPKISKPIPDNAFEALNVE